MKSLLIVAIICLSAEALALGSPNPGVVGGMGNSVSTLNQVHQDQEDRVENVDLKKRQEQEDGRGEAPIDPRRPLTREEKDFNKNEPY